MRTPLAQPFPSIGPEIGPRPSLGRSFEVVGLTGRLRSIASAGCATDVLDPREVALARLAVSAEARDPYATGHCDRLARLSLMMAHALGLPERDMLALQWGALLHDIGTVAIPEAILLKPGRLSDAEYDLVKQHTVIGDQLCDLTPTLDAARRIVRQHHERLDGSGYPDGLSGVQITLLAQIFGLVDTYDSMTMARSYRPALPGELAIESLRADAARGAVRGVLVDVFERVLLTR